MKGREGKVKQVVLLPTPHRQESWSLSRCLKRLDLWDKPPNYFSNPSNIHAFFTTLKFRN